MSRIAALDQVEMVLRGPLPPGVRDEAHKKIVSALRYASEPILHVRVTLTRSPSAAVDRPITAEANVDLNGRFVRAHAAGATAREAIDRLVPKLRRLLARRARHWQARRGRQQPQRIP